MATVFCPDSGTHSSKTRIETTVMVSYQNQNGSIQEHIPAKQGLKLYKWLNIFLNYEIIQEHIPAKQGLKHGLSYVMQEKIKVFRNTFQQNKD